MDDRDIWVAFGVTKPVPAPKKAGPSRKPTRRVKRCPAASQRKEQPIQWYCACQWKQAQGWEPAWEPEQLQPVHELAEAVADAAAFRKVQHLSMRG